MAPVKYQPYDLDPGQGKTDSEQRDDNGDGLVPAAASSVDGGVGGDDEEGSQDDEIVDDAPKGRHITPLEAALAAFRQQRKMISKVSGRRASGGMVAHSI